MASWALRITSWVEGRACLPHGSHVAPDIGKELLAQTLEKQAKDQLARPSPAVTHLGRQQG